MKHGELLRLLVESRRPVVDPGARALARRMGGPRARWDGWRGGDAWVERIARARSAFDVEVELRDAERFGFLSPKTRERGARAAEARLAELRGEL